MQTDKTFKTCPFCAHNWYTRTEFLNDRTLKLNGYQADFEALGKGLFFFTHHVEGCYTTMTILSAAFYDMYSGKRYAERKTGSEECPGYCLLIDCLERCSVACECAFVREIIQIIRERQASGQPAGG